MFDLETPESYNPSRIHAGTFMRFLLMASIMCVAGCVQSDYEMREKPPARQFTSAKSADDLVSCLVPSISGSYRGAYGRRDLFTANVRAPGQEYDIVTPNALVGGRYTFTVNVREGHGKSTVSIFEIMPIAGYMREGLSRGIETCL